MSSGASSRLAAGNLHSAPIPPEIPRRLPTTTPRSTISVDRIPASGGTVAASNSNTQPSRHERVREIHKNAWLKRLYASYDKKGTPVVKRVEKWWVVFCVHDDTKAYLEFYSEPKMAQVHKPANRISLISCLHVSPSILGQENEFQFAVTLSSQVIYLATLDWDQMLEWVESLQGKLREMNILSPKDNLYTKLPETKNYHPKFALGPVSTRDPNSPLPPTPNRREFTSTTSQLFLTEASIITPITPFFDTLERHPHLTSRDSGTSTNMVGSGRSIPRIDTSNETPEINCSPNNIAVPSIQCHLPGGNSSLVASALNTNNTAIVHTDLEGAGQISMDDQLPDAGNISENINLEKPSSHVPLKESQVKRLNFEINHPSGVRITLRRKDCLDTIAFVDYLGAVWIAGWKQHPVLYYAFHVGDQVISIHGQKVQCGEEIRKAIRRSTTHQVEFIIKRLPHGKVFVLKRKTEGEPLGLVTEGNCSEISDVVPNSLAAVAGLAPKAMCIEENSMCNWALTEINNRPLSLVARESEIRDRLNAVGKEITILVQPSDLVKQLKKQLKTLKGFKEYLVV